MPSTMRTQSYFAAAEVGERRRARFRGGDKLRAKENRQSDARHGDGADSTQGKTPPQPGARNPLDARRPLA
jgi:hypothetical protein